MSKCPAWLTPCHSLAQSPRRPGLRKSLHLDLQRQPGAQGITQMGQGGHCGHQLKQSHRSTPGFWGQWGQRIPMTIPCPGLSGRSNPTHCKPQPSAVSGGHNRGNIRSGATSKWSCRHLPGQNAGPLEVHRPLLLESPFSGEPSW